MEKGLLITVSGFSGAGKGTLMKKLISEYPDEYALSISATTRSPREGEVEGREYFFKTKEEFEELIKNDNLIEYAQYVGNYYGTPKEFVEQQMELGKDIFLEIEVQGACQIKKKYPDAILIFVTPPSIEELERRLVGRQTETEETIKKRLSRAKEEVDYIDDYDYLLVNDDLDQAIKDLRNIIAAEHCSSKNKLQLVEQLKGELGGLK